MEIAPFLGIGCFGFFGLVALALTGFWIWMLVDCLQYEPSDDNDKLIWVLVIILLGWIGAIIYYFVRRPNRPPPDHYSDDRY